MGKILRIGAMFKRQEIPRYVRGGGVSLLIRLRRRRRGLLYRWTKHCFRETLGNAETKSSAGNLSFRSIAPRWQMQSSPTAKPGIKQWGAHNPGTENFRHVRPWTPGDLR